MEVKETETVASFRLSQLTMLKHVTCDRWRLVFCSQFPILFGPAAVVTQLCPRSEVKGSTAHSQIDGLLGTWSAATPSTRFFPFEGPLLRSLIHLFCFAAISSTISFNDFFFIVIQVLHRKLDFKNQIIYQKKSPFKNHLLWLERWLSCEEYLLLLQMTWVQLTTPPWQFTTACVSVPKNSTLSSGLHRDQASTQHTDTHASKILIR